MSASNRGRPPKYSSDPEREQARRECGKAYVRKHADKTERDLGQQRYLKYLSALRWIREYGEIGRCFPKGVLPDFLRHALLDPVPSNHGDREEWAFLRLGEALEDLVAGREADAESRALALQLQMQSQVDTSSHMVSLGCDEILRDRGEPITERGRPATGRDVALAFRRATVRCLELARQSTAAGEPLRYIESMIVLGTLHSHYQRIAKHYERIIEEVQSSAEVYFDAAFHLLERLPKRDPLVSMLEVEALLREVEHLTHTLNLPERAKKSLERALRLAECEIGDPAVCFEASKEATDFYTGWGSRGSLDKAQEHLEKARKLATEVATDPFQAELSLCRREIPLLSATNRRSEAINIIRSYVESSKSNPCAFQWSVIQDLADFLRLAPPTPPNELRLKCGVNFFYSENWVERCVLRWTHLKDRNSQEGCQGRCRTDCSFEGSDVRDDPAEEAVSNNLVKLFQ